MRSAGAFVVMGFGAGPGGVRLPEQRGQLAVGELPPRPVPAPGAGRGGSGVPAHPAPPRAPPAPPRKPQAELVPIVSRDPARGVHHPALAVHGDGAPSHGQAAPSGKVSRSRLTSDMKRSASAPSTTR